MKVYFIGAHAVGKSTLARYVSQKYNIPMISETARMVLSEQELQIDSLRCDLEIADSYQQQVFDRQIAEEQKYDSFVSDRSILDVLAYSCQHARILRALVVRPELQEYVNQLREQFIIFVRPSKATMRSDGVRESLTWDGIIEIDAMLKFMLCMWDIPHFQINMSNIQERVKLIDAVLSLQQK